MTLRRPFTWKLRASLLLRRDTTQASTTPTGPEAQASRWASWWQQGSYATSGLLLSGALLLGSGLGAIGVLLDRRVHQPAPTDQGRLVELRGLNPADQPKLTDYVETPGRCRVTLLARALAPPNGVAVVILYGSRPGGNDIAIGRFECRNASWSHWEQTLDHPRFRLRVEGAPAGEVSATKVDLFVYVGGVLGP